DGHSSSAPRGLPGYNSRRRETEQPHRRGAPRMAWIIGIDEAGYGPNLGPFVMTSVACRVPDALQAADLWRVLQAAVRRHTEPADDRLLVEDSKLVYSSARGLLGLETGVLAAAAPGQLDAALRLAGYVAWPWPRHPD